jgi:signal transduction histidine kinase
MGAPMNWLLDGVDDERAEIERCMRAHAAIAFALAGEVDVADLAARVLPALQDQVCGIALFAVGSGHQAPVMCSHAGVATLPAPEQVAALLLAGAGPQRDRAIGNWLEPAPAWLGPACAAAVLTRVGLDAGVGACVLFALRSATMSRAFAAALRLVAQRMGDCLLGQSARGEPQHSTAVEGSGEVKVLLVDDEPLLTAHLKRLLRQHGFAFHAAERGAEGLKLAETIQPHAILVDKVLPDMDGIDVLCALRRNDRLSTVPVIMLSGHADEAARVRALRAGADDFVAKPFSSKELVARIRANVQMAQVRRAAVWRETELMRLRQSREELRKLLDTVQSVRVDERRRLAREVHDQLGQVLTAAKIELRLLEERVLAASPARPDAAALDGLASALTSIDLAIASVQNIAILLRPPALEQGGLMAALRWLAADWQRRTRLTCTVLGEPSGFVEPEQFVGGELLRICQEALTNVMRHANASAVTIQVGMRGLSFMMRVADNGVGIARGTARSADAIGLAGMRERAASIRAGLHVRGRPGCGTIVSVWRRRAIP